MNVTRILTELTEQERAIENYKKHVINESIRKMKENSELIQNFIKYCQSFGVTLSNKNFVYIQTIGIVANHPNLLNLLNNSITMDKEGLVSFDILRREFEFQPFASGYLFSENYMAMAHPYFRRGHFENSNFSPRFLDVFWSYNHKVNHQYISLDFDRVRVNVDNSMYMEADTWFGAKFKENISEIEDGIVKLRPPIDLDSSYVDFLFGDSYSLNIKWYTKKGVKVFQAEEFKTEKYRIVKEDIEYFPAKYIHSEFDVHSGTFRHFDGAIHFYSEEEYYHRRDTDFNHNYKNDLHLKPISQKLFKINGVIAVTDWVELTSQFMSGNPLILEYFEGELPERIIEIIEVIRKK